MEKKLKVGDLKIEVKQYPNGQKAIITMKVTGFIGRFTTFELVDVKIE